MSEVAFSLFFKGAMVRAILDGRKTQTRRIVDRLKGFPKIRQFGRSDTPVYDWHFRCKRGLWHDMRESQVLELCPYGKPGDRLWVRETWGVAAIYDKTKPSDICQDILSDPNWPLNKAPCGVRYPANMDCVGVRIRPSIHMPRWASRITLEITDVRVQRLNDISRDDAKAEGIERFGFSEHAIDTPGGEEMVDLRCWRNYTNPRTPFGSMSQIHSFASLWESINGEGSWDANPYVWAIEFKRCE